MICPKCGSNNCHYVTKTHTSRGSFCDGCCGFILFGPIGILCGLCDSDSSTKEYWVCENCGSKFQSSSAVSSAPNNSQVLNITYKSDLPDPLPEEYDRFSPGNVLSGGMATCYGSFFYYVKSTGILKNKIVRQALGGAKIEITADAACYLFADANNLYYIADAHERKIAYSFKIYCLPNSSNQSHTILDRYVSEMCFDGKYIYYIDDSNDKGSIYRINPNGSQNLKVCDAKASNLISYGNKLYFIDKGNGHMLLSAAKDTGKTDIVIARKQINQFCISEGIIYYSLTTFNEFGNVYVFNLINGQSGNLGELGGNFINVHNKIIYYSDSGTIQKYDLRKNLRTNITNIKGVKKLSICCKNMFYGSDEEVTGVLSLNSYKYEEL